MLHTVDANLTQRPTTVNMQKIQVFVVLSSTWVIWTTSFLPRLRNIFGRRQKDSKCQMWEVSTRKGFLDTEDRWHRRSYVDWESMHKTCTCSIQTKSQHERGMWLWRTTPKSEAVVMVLMAYYVLTLIHILKTWRCGTYTIFIEKLWFYKSV